MKKVLTLYKTFMLKAQTALATGHFSNQVEFWGAVVPPPPPSSSSKDVQYKSGASVFGTNKKDLQYEEGTSSVQSISSVKMVSSLWKAAEINQLENIERNL